MRQLSFLLLTFLAACSFAQEPFDCAAYLAHIEAIAQSVENRPFWLSEYANPFVGSRPRGIAGIRRLIKRHGVVSAVHGKKPKSELAQRQIEFRYGTPVIYVGDIPAGPAREVDEVVLHRGEAYLLARKLRSRHANPYLGFGQLDLRLSNKWIEYTVHYPFLPETIGLDAFLELNDNSIRGINDLRRGLAEKLQTAFASQTPELFLERHDAELASLVDRLFDAAKRKFGDAIFKDNHGYASASSPSGIISTKGSPQVIETWVRQFGQTIKELAQGRPTKITNWMIEKRLMQSKWKVSNLFLYHLLFGPNNQIVQTWLETHGGQKFRVDYIDGEPVHAFSPNLYLEPTLEKLAMGHVTKVMGLAPIPFGYGAGGADIEINAAGRPILRELNPGADSGSADPLENAIASNIILSRIMGRHTPLIADFETVFQSTSLPTKARFFKNLKRYLTERLGISNRKIMAREMVYAAGWFQRRYFEKVNSFRTVAAARAYAPAAQFELAELLKFYEEARDELEISDPESPYYHDNIVFEFQQAVEEHFPESLLR